MFCARCGTGMSDDAGFCPACGTPVQRNQPAPPPVYQAPPPPPPPPPPVYQAPPPPRQVYQPPPPPPVYQAPPPPPQNWPPPQQAQPVAQPPQAWPQPPGVVAPQLRYADFGKRLLAYLIDTVIVGAAFMVLFVIVLLMVGGGAIFSGNESIGDFAGAIAGFGILLFVLLIFGSIIGVWLYFAKSESSPSQATIGKRTMGIYVTDLQGQRLSFGRASGRFFSKLITNMIPFWIGWIMAAFTERKQALHDMIAGTLVLRRG
jgi:uncharacterized RDD family membrane protein YckC